MYYNFLQNAGTTACQASAHRIGIPELLYPVGSPTCCSLLFPLLFSPLFFVVLFPYLMYCLPFPFVFRCSILPRVYLCTLIYSLSGVSWFSFLHPALLQQTLATHPPLPVYHGTNDNVWLQNGSGSIHASRRAEVRFVSSFSSFRTYVAGRLLALALCAGLPSEPWLWQAWGVHPTNHSDLLPQALVLVQCAILWSRTAHRIEQTHDVSWVLARFIYSGLISATSSRIL
jgi:hypothetical protein